jgi:hypothetical protein
MANQYIQKHLKFLERKNQVKKPIATKQSGNEEELDFDQIVHDNKEKIESMKRKTINLINKKTAKTFKITQKRRESNYKSKQDKIR